MVAVGLKFDGDDDEISLDLSLGRRSAQWRGPGGQPDYVSHL